MSADRKNTSNF